MRLPRFISERTRKGENPASNAGRHFDDLSQILGKWADVLEEKLAGLALLQREQAASIPPAILGKGKVYDVRSFASLAKAVSHIGSDTATLYITKQVALSSNLTIPSNISVVRVEGGGFTSSNASEITIRGPFSSPLTQAFYGDLVVAGMQKVKALFPQWWGAKGDGSTDDTTAIRAALAVAVNGGKVLIPDTGSDYMVSDVLRIPASSKITIEWEGKSFIRLSQNTVEGGIFGTGAHADVTFINPRIDADGFEGENGIGANTGATVRVYGGYLRNFPVHSGNYTGGKPINADGWGSRLFVDGTRIADSHSAFWIKRDYATDPSTDNPTQAVITNVIAENCDIFAYVAVRSKAVSAFDGTEISVSISNFRAFNCGRDLPVISSGTHGAVFLFESATRVAISNGIIDNNSSYNSGLPIQSIFRGRGREISVSNVEVHCDAVALVDIDPVPDYAFVITEMGNNYYNLSATGTYSYVYKSDLTDATFPFRFLKDSYIETRLTNDVTVSLVTPATRNGVTWLKTTQANKVILATAADYNSHYTTMAVAQVGLNLGRIKVKFGGGGGAASVEASSTSPSYAWNETDAGTNEKNWDLIASSGILTLRALNDAYGGASAIWSVTRSGAIPTQFTVTPPLAAPSFSATTTIVAGGKITANYGGGAGLASFEASSASPSYAWNETGVGTDAKNWDLIANAEILSLRALNDAYSVANTVWSVTRSGATITDFAITSDTSIGGDLSLPVAGKGVKLKEGSNAKAGTATLTAGTVTVNTTAVAAGDRILLWRLALNGSTALGELTPGTITAGTSFVINSYDAAAALETGDASSVYWEIRTPA